MQNTTFFIRAFHEIITSAVPHDGREGSLPILVLVHLHLNGPSTSVELERALSIPQSAVSRATAYLRDGKYRGRKMKHEWIGAIESTPDPHQARRYIHKITRKGDRLLASIAKPMAKAAGAATAHSFGLTVQAETEN